MPPSLFDRLAQEIGPLHAMTLCAFHRGHGGGSNDALYVPGFYTQGHLIERVIGQAAFLRLIAGFGGESIVFPTMLLNSTRVLGEVRRRTQRGASTQEIANALGRSYRNIRRIQVELTKTGPLTDLARESQRNDGGPSASELTRGA